MIILDKLVQKINWSLPNSKPVQLYMYGEANVEANQAMQVPLEKLYQYERYIDELETEIKRVETEIANTDNDNGYEARMMTRLSTLSEVRNDLLGILLK